VRPWSLKTRLIIIFSLLAGQAVACEPGDYPAVFRSNSLAVGVWSAADGNPPPACRGTGQPAAVVLVQSAGSFSEPGGAAAILRRLAGLSRYPGIHYWSVTRGRWRTLITKAQRLDADGAPRPGDLPEESLNQGSQFWFHQEENTPAGSVDYVLTVEEADADHLSLDLRNTRPIRFLGLTMFAPGEYRFHHAFWHGAADQWTYRGEFEARGTTDIPFADRGPSYANRAQAVFRYLAGLPSETEPLK